MNIFQSQRTKTGGDFRTGSRQFFRPPPRIIGITNIFAPTVRPKSALDALVGPTRGINKIL